MKAQGQLIYSQPRLTTSLPALVATDRYYANRSLRINHWAITLRAIVAPLKFKAES